MHGKSLVRKRTEEARDKAHDGSSGQAGEYPLTAWVPAYFNIRKSTMLYTLAVVLLILWLLGMVTSVAAGGLIHILLVAAVVVVLLRVISGRKIL
jgi:hypothetical protein